MRSVPGVVTTGCPKSHDGRVPKTVTRSLPLPVLTPFCKQKAGINMDLGLKDRVALVAAASRGIGYAAALELAREGARVFLCSRDEMSASAAAQKIHEETGANVAGIASHGTNDNQTEELGNPSLERAGPLDV